MTPSEHSKVFSVAIIIADADDDADAVVVDILRMVLLLQVVDRRAMRGVNLRRSNGMV